MKSPLLTVLAVASLGLVACQGSVTNGAGGDGGEGGTTETTTNTSTTSTTSTSTTTSTVPCNEPKDMPAFDIGTGEKCFAKVTDGDTLPLMNGPQGGYHMWLAAGCKDCGTTVHLKYGARDPATGMPLAGTGDLESMIPLGDGALFMNHPGIVVYMPGLSWDPMTEPPPAKGSQLVLWADAIAADGTVQHHAERLVTVGDTMSWDPCVENPSDPQCGYDGP
ncbi:MAG: hypothetical protein U0441_18995 [Polyangiaceae bacterium]